MRESQKTAGRSALFGLVFFGLGVLIEYTSFPPTTSAAVALTSGLALAVFVRLPPAHWPLYLATLFVAEAAKAQVTVGPLPLSLAWSVANCLRTLLAAWAIRRWAGGPLHLNGVREVVGFIVFGGLLAPCVSATVGATSIVLWHPGAAAFRLEWLVWWLSDSLGILLFAPLLLTWWSLPRELARRENRGVAVVLFGVTAATGVLLFAGPATWSFLSSLTYLPFPLIAWAALRLGPAGSAAMVLVLAALAVGFSTAGRGPFGALLPDSPQERLLTVQAYLAVMGMSACLLAAMVAERRWAARSQRLLARFGALLAEAGDDAAALSAIAPEVAPELAPGFVAWVADEDGRFERVAQQGVGPSLASALTTLLGASSGRWVDPEGRAVLVPMLLHEQRLGAVALVSEDAQRRLRDRELAFAEELAWRCALSVENHRLLARTRRAIQTRDEFITIAAHELRTPLTGFKLQVQAVARLLRGTPEAAHAHPRLSALDRQATRLSRLVDGLLDVGGVSSGKLQLAREEVRLDALVRELVEAFRETFEQAGCRVTLRLEEGVGGAWDRLRIEQVVTNLLANAAKFGAGRPLEVEVTQVGDLARLTVRDYGPGMDAHAQERIFEPFEQAVNAREYGGLGLGLYLTRELVEAHGGEVRVDSRPGEGATFTVELPALAPMRAQPWPSEPHPHVH